ncbi:uncharacterized protein BDZ99DRAFT_459549 [Mytilinidion resinicola]|uniref:Uncharacterized protein n=1 Tax=Mytilinidion resinicola TaxID=574789 RepID=A0A6A6YZC0_9PEZI|nr:uncharacterized protein BDZ99DRAFT_459549 [Mytilinidion resinicola]KAF2813793.1 hypothetical protein BDZ99DRAFT_459549 [Mytilinidion resinicola]
MRYEHYMKDLYYPQDELEIKRLIRLWALLRRESQINNGNAVDVFPLPQKCPKIWDEQVYTAEQQALSDSDDDEEQPIPIVKLRLPWLKDRVNQVRSTEKQITHIRRRLQRGFRFDGERLHPPEEHEISIMSSYLRLLEQYPRLEMEIVRKTRIDNALKHIDRLDTFPRNEMFQLKQQARDLLIGWGVNPSSSPSTPDGEQDISSTSCLANERKRTAVEESTLSRKIRKISGISSTDESSNDNGQYHSTYPVATSSVHQRPPYRAPIAPMLPTTSSQPTTRLAQPHQLRKGLQSIDGVLGTPTEMHYGATSPVLGVEAQQTLAGTDNISSTAQRAGPTPTNRPVFCTSPILLQTSSTSDGESSTSTSSNSVSKPATSSPVELLGTGIEVDMSPPTSAPNSPLPERQGSGDTIGIRPISATFFDERTGMLRGKENTAKGKASRSPSALCVSQERQSSSPEGSLVIDTPTNTRRGPTPRERSPATISLLCENKSKRAKPRSLGASSLASQRNWMQKNKDTVAKPYSPVPSRGGVLLPLSGRATESTSVSRDASLPRERASTSTQSSTRQSSINVAPTGSRHCLSRLEDASAIGRSSLERSRANNTPTSPRGDRPSPREASPAVRSSTEHSPIDHASTDIQRAHLIKEAPTVSQPSALHTGTSVSSSIPIQLNASSTSGASDAHQEGGSTQAESSTGQTSEPIQDKRTRQEDGNVQAVGNVSQTSERTRDDSSSAHQRHGSAQAEMNASQTSGPPENDSNNTPRRGGGIQPEGSAGSTSKSIQNNRTYQGDGNAQARDNARQERKLIQADDALNDALFGLDDSDDMDDEDDENEEDENKLRRSFGMLIEPEFIRIEELVERQLLYQDRAELQDDCRRQVRLDKLLEKFWNLAAKSRGELQSSLIDRQTRALKYFISMRTMERAVSIADTGNTASVKDFEGRKRAAQINCARRKLIRRWEKVGEGLDGGSVKLLVDVIAAVRTMVMSPAYLEIFEKYCEALFREPEPLIF